MDKKKRAEQQEVTLEELKQMAKTDPMTVDKDTLVDIKDVKVRTDLEKEERIMDFISQIKNPYCYLDNGMVVKISFSGTKSLEDCLKDCTI